MNKQDFDKNTQQEPFDLEQCLSTYYGPPLREQPLSASSWQHLRLQLGPQKSAGRRARFHWPLPRTRSRIEAPATIQNAFARIAYEARVPYIPSTLHCQLTLHTHEPEVRSSWPGKCSIQLFLPVNTVTTLGQAELDVLLATGLARSLCARKLAYRLGRLLLAGVALMACIMLALFWMRHVPLPGFSLVIALWAGVMWGWHRQACAIAFRADTLMVLWLGRGHICTGLHALADRSRSPRRRRWGEPSLAERIERVCGTRTETREDALTLVR
ncbi:MAG TPA: hypothetical protein VL485_13555 [Ktedonobacteraceae bacterium]|jgi:hypothetical protein|nr:hypothetical protein [Ktedonobacteraceae bacterium]